LTLSVSHDEVKRTNLMRRVALRTQTRSMDMRRFDRAKEEAVTFIRNRKVASEQIGTLALLLRHHRASTTQSGGKNR